MLSVTPFFFFSLHIRSLTPEDLNRPHLLLNRWKKLPKKDIGWQTTHPTASPCLNLFRNALSTHSHCQEPWRREGLRHHSPGLHTHPPIFSSVSLACRTPLGSSAVAMKLGLFFPKLWACALFLMASVIADLQEAKVSEGSSITVQEQRSYPGV